MTPAGNSSRIRSQDGFTLLEIIIAVTLVAMIAVAIWGVMSISIRAWSRGTQLIDANQRHRSILSMVRKQLASACGALRPVGQMGGFSPSVIFSGTESRLLFVSLNSLQFLDSPGLTMVSYEIDQDANGNYSLVEKEARYLGTGPDEGFADPGSKTVPIFENLTGCLFEYRDPGDSDNPPQWVREWDGQKALKLPLAVSLTMSSRDASGNNLSRHMVVPLKAEGVTTQYNPLNPFGR